MFPRALSVVGHTSLTSKHDLQENLLARTINGTPTNGDGDDAKIKSGFFLIRRLTNNNKS